MFYRDKVTVWVFVPTEENPISATDLLIYSHLSYKSKYSEKLNSSRIAWNTGVCRQTVKSSLKNLKELGLLKDGKPQYKPEWFMTRTPTEEEKTKTKELHWSQKIQYWRCLVRMENSPLTITDTMVFCYLLKRFLAKQFPKRWTCTYLANALCCDPRTVGKSLERLEENQLVQIDHEKGDWKIAESLVGNQNLWFRRKEKITAGNSVLKSFMPDFSPEAVAKRDELKNEKAEQLRLKKVKDSAPLPDEKIKFIEEVKKMFKPEEAEDCKKMIMQCFSLPNWETSYPLALEQLPDIPTKEKRAMFFEMMQNIEEWKKEFGDNLNQLELTEEDKKYEVMS